MLFCHSNLSSKIQRFNLRFAHTPLKISAVEIKAAVASAQVFFTAHYLLLLCST